MTLDKIIEEFTEEYTERAPHATKEEVKEVLKQAESILKSNKDKTPEEIINIMIEECVEDLNAILESTRTPGILSELKVDNIDICLLGGKSNKDSLTKEALFDIASITKLYTEVLAYKLINEKAFSLKSKIEELDPRFSKVGNNLTVEDILRFLVSFRTNGRIEDASTKEEAEERLFTIEVVQIGQKYDYNDMGLMIMKEVMERVTNKSFQELLEEYILRPYGLKNTYLEVPEDKIHLVAGTPNQNGSVNDLKANVLGGYSGHAGIRATSQDLLDFTSHVMEDEKINQGLFIPNEYMNNRSNKMGNAYVNPKFFKKADGEIISGKNRSYFGSLAPIDSLASQGSTRVIARGEKARKTIITSTALSNIASLSDEETLELIAKKNEEILKKDPNAKVLNPSDLIKVRVWNQQEYKMHDPRRIMNEDQTLGSILYKYDNKIILKLLLLNKILKEQEHYDKDIYIERDITKERSH